jgi:hypothetical protein
MPRSVVCMVPDAVRAGTPATDLLAVRDAAVPRPS